MTMSNYTKKGRVWIVLAAYNEAAALPLLLPSISSEMTASGFEYQVVLVDDGSRDLTPDIARQFAEQMPLQLLIHPQNLGLGATIRDGIAAAARQAASNDVIVTLDADNTHPAPLITQMVRMAWDTHDVVIASRYQAGSEVHGLSRIRRFMSFGASVLLRAVFPISGAKDYTCGFRAYRAWALQQLLERQGNGFHKNDGFQVMVDLLLELRRDNRLSFGEVPLVLRYDLKEGESKMKVGRTILATLRLVAEKRLPERRN